MFSHICHCVGGCLFYITIAPCIALYDLAVESRVRESLTVDRLPEAVVPHAIIDHQHGSPPPPPATYSGVYGRLVPAVEYAHGWTDARPLPPANYHQPTAGGIIALDAVQLGMADFPTDFRTVPIGGAPPGP